LWKKDFDIFVLSILSQLNNNKRNELKQIAANLIKLKLFSKLFSSIL